VLPISLTEVRFTSNDAHAYSVHVARRTARGRDERDRPAREPTVSGDLERHC
jgi:hypothetical protein